MGHPSPLCPVHNTNEVLIGCPCNDWDGTPTRQVATMPSQKDMLEFVAVRWPHLVTIQARINKVIEEAGEVMGAWTKMSDGTGRKTRADLAQETAQLVMCAMALAEAGGFDLRQEIADEWERINRRVWPTGGSKGRD